MILAKGQSSICLKGIAWFTACSLKGNYREDAKFDSYVNVGKSPIPVGDEQHSTCRKRGLLKNR
ncbi:hypothetical protein BC8716_20940 [Shouchella clausii]|nr:hypothetical protein BC8716_20940 [Shouchella clausii]PAF14598.1 hypothetical protein CHH59_07510 [Shouchella clausii]QNM44715.1 hypothetical protein DUT88_18255 [Shouchella clausii]